MPAAVSVGTNPTFDGMDRRVEAYVLGVDDIDLYDQAVAVSFVQQLRGQQRFADVGALVAQMAADVARVDKILSDHSPSEVSSLLGG
jgi:riboflavin kinase / FMN adenylyltransferase